MIVDVGTPVGRCVAEAARTAPLDRIVAGALLMTGRGDDTFDIARSLRISEACAARIVAAWREARPRPPQRSATTLMDRVIELSAQLEAAEARVAWLEDELRAVDVTLPSALGLTAAEAAILRVLIARPVAAKDMLMTVTSTDIANDDRDDKIIDVMVHKLRKKLRPHGVEIRTHWGQGWSLDDDARRRLGELEGSDAA